MTRPAKLDCLDGLRGLAILAVILFHHRLECQLLPHSTLYRILAPTRFGFVGVHLFLVLSGFCLTNSLIRKARAGRNYSLRQYLTDRWWRIAPPFYAAMILCLIARPIFRLTSRVVLGNEAVNFSIIAKHIFFIHGLSNDSFEAINSPFWSLSLEFQFYATLPLLFVLSQRFGYRRVVIAVALLSLAWRAASIRWLMYQADLMDGFFLGRWTEFAFGMLAAAWYNDDRRRSEQVQTWIVVLATSIALSLIGSGIVLNFLGDGLVFNQVIGAGCALFLVAVIRSSESNGYLANLVSAKPLVWIGVMSYSLYLTHSLALGWVDRGYITWGIEGSWRTELLLFLASATSVGFLGFAFYQVVERKFMRSVDTSKPKLLANTPWSGTTVHV